MKENVDSKKVKAMLQAFDDRLNVLEQLSGACEESDQAVPETAEYVISKTHGIFHKPDCYCLNMAFDENKQVVNWDRQTCMDHNLRACKKCQA